MVENLKPKKAMTKKIISILQIILILILFNHLGFGQKSFKNIVVLFIDDLGYGDTGPYGVKDIPTPNMDRLAREGVVFTQGYVPGPPCSPSRASLMMGMYPQRFGKYGMSRGLPIPEDKPTIADFFKNHGFITGQIGKWDLGSYSQTPLNSGFMEKEKKVPRKLYSEEEMLALKESSDPVQRILFQELTKKKKYSKYIYIKEDGTEGWLTDYDGDMAVEFIETHKDKPFFLYFSPEALHSFNWEASAELRNRTHATGKRSYLAGALVSVDDQVGKILTVLDKYNLRENTLIMFSSDNGPNPNEKGSASPYRGGKFNGTQFEGWVHVPLILSMPGVIPQGQHFDGLSMTLDLFPTAAAINGLKAPEQCDGVNLIPFLQNKKNEDPHEYIFWLNNDPNDSKHRHIAAVRWEDFRLIQDKISGNWNLFNIKKDPREERNIAPQFPEKVRSMIDAHQKWQAGHVSPPAFPSNPTHAQKKRIKTPPKGYGMWPLNNKM